MKYIVVLGDGMADEPIEQLGGKTPLAAAVTPMMDELAARGMIGMTATIPHGMAPGSDTANLAVMGYNPRDYYTGRSPLEALSIGVPMKDTDIALRCNLVTLSDEPASPMNSARSSTTPRTRSRPKTRLSCLRQSARRSRMTFTSSMWAPATAICSSGTTVI